MPSKCDTPGCGKTCIFCEDLPICSEEKHWCGSPECKCISILPQQALEKKKQTQVKPLQELPQLAAQEKIPAIFGFCPWCKTHWTKCCDRSHTNTFHTMLSCSKILLNPAAVVKKIPYIDYSNKIVIKGEDGLDRLYYKIKYRREIVPFPYF